MRILIDTDVLFDLFAQRKPYTDEMKRLIMMQIVGDVELWATPQAYLDVFYLMRNVNDRTLVQRSIAASLRHVNVCALGHVEVEKAIEYPSMDESMTAVCCENTGADYLITRKPEAYASLGTPALTPAEYIDLMATKHKLTYELPA
ncbi:Uncharacterised protein [Slackia heliotrinireducens]|uniref:PIN domain-containing protein n=1 Tax=Slackia heliotrinireducens (strain ATCC 29202 / DSM 20476 / NCTC 11029 / RHS 1) TaxID=471855 RepID=C7N1Z1_SLAHD|nr:PIN domain-containing protein [Slackia heliotrinireducens]ACV23432.1 hypothetical protein Shel_24240 [Slackia heliotrinireducens DSM 20476]VEH02733.1 Uncharacterised protein [Slackia heliotrinireducens]